MRACMLVRRWCNVVPEMLRWMDGMSMLPPTPPRPSAVKAAATRAIVVRQCLCPHRPTALVRGAALPPLRRVDTRGRGRAVGERWGGQGSFRQGGPYAYARPKSGYRSYRLVRVACLCRRPLFCYTPSGGKQPGGQGQQGAGAEHRTVVTGPDGIAPKVVFPREGIPSFNQLGAHGAVVGSHGVYRALGL